VIGSAFRRLCTKSLVMSSPTIDRCGSNVLPPSVERMYSIVLPPSMCHTMCSAPSADTDKSGAKVNGTSRLPGASAPLPVQVTPWSVDRANFSGCNAPQAT
jgi:hypothetical protein